MGNYKKKINPITGQLQLVNNEGLLFFKDAVTTFANLPASGNTINDARIATDTGHLYVWNETSWIDQGDIIDLDWSTLSGKPSSSVVDIDDAVSKKHSNTLDHIQNTDTKLITDESSPQEVEAVDVLDAVNKKHTQGTDIYNADDIVNDSLGSGYTVKDALDNIRTELNGEITKTYYVDGKRTDLYTENGSILKPYKKLSDCLLAIEADILVRLEASETRSECHYNVELNPSIYSDALIIPACASLQINLNGSTLSGDIIRTVTQVGYGAEYYSKLIFNGNSARRAEKGHQAVVSGNITCNTSEGTNYLYYTTMNGIEFSGNFTATNGVANLMLHKTSLYTTSKTILGTGAILLESYEGTRIKATISGNVALYNVIDSEFSGTINVNSINTHTLRNMIFGGSVTISAGTIKCDAISYDNLKDGNLTGATVILDDKASAINNDSSVEGATVKDALNTLDSEKTTLSDVKLDGDIADVISDSHTHDNKSDLDNVSGTNTGDQDLSEYVKFLDLKYTNKWFVSSDLGDDDNDGLSETTAFATIDKALESCSEYGIINVLDSNDYTLTSPIIIPDNVTLNMPFARLKGEIRLGNSSRFIAKSHYPSANGQTMVSCIGTAGSAYTVYGMNSTDYSNIIHFKPATVGGYIVAHARHITVGSSTIGNENILVYSTAGSSGVNIATDGANFSSDKALGYGTPADLVYGDTGYCQWYIDVVGLPIVITYDIGTGTIVSSYKMKATSSGTRMPKNWTLHGQLAGGGWELLDTQSGILWNAYEEKEFTISSPANYDEYKITVSLSEHDTRLQIDDIGFISGVASVGGDIMITADILSLGEYGLGILSYDSSQRVITNFNNIYQINGTSNAIFIDMSNGNVSHTGGIATVDTLWNKTGGFLIWNVPFDSGTKTGNVEIISSNVTSGAGAPASTPIKIGDIYVDISNKKLYFAVGTSSSADWIIAN